MREKRGGKFLKNISKRKQLLLGDKIRRFLIIFFDILFLANLGMAIGSYEFFTGEYSADFNMHDAVQFWCYSAMFMYCVNRFADRVCDARSKETKNGQ